MPYKQFNAQPHIDTIRTGLIGTKEHSSEKYTFMLRHKHFDLAADEALFVTKVAKGYDITVKRLDELEAASPCMWLFDGGWKAFGYTTAGQGVDEVPDVKEGGYNLGVRWLNNGGIESTDSEQRVQWVRPGGEGGKIVTTLVNWKQESECETFCFMTGCMIPEGEKIHAPTRHEKSAHI